MTLFGSALAARSLVRRLPAQVVVGTGGYVSAPAVLGGRLASRPVLLFEPNAEPGMANRWLSRLATEAAVAYPETGEHFRCPVRLTGVPVREEFFRIPRELPTSGPMRLLVLGGSQGAQQLNETVPRALGRLWASGHLPSRGLEIVHQAGGGKLEATRASYAAEDLGEIGVEILPFLDDVAAAMASSHLLISRAGAITLAEICAAGRPSLLVPLAVAAGGHQVANARRLHQAGAAHALLPKAAGAEEMAEILGRLVGNPPELEQMAAAAGQLGRATAAADLAHRVEALAGVQVGNGRQRAPAQGGRS